MTSIYQRRDIWKLAAGGALALTGGCAALFPASPPRLFTIPAPEPQPSQGAPLKWKLAVALPDISQALDTNRIALRRGKYEFDYFADASWPERVSGVVQGLLIDAIQGTARVTVVQKDTLGLQTDFLLLTQLKEFEAQYPDSGDAAPEIRVRLVAQLARSEERTIVDSLEVAETHTASANKIEAIVAAFGACADAAVARVAAWVITTGQHDYGPPS